MSILVMVVQSWEDESRRLRGKDISALPSAVPSMKRRVSTPAPSPPCSSWCERLEMQLIIAAPENISPEKGTTYKLVRKVFNNQRTCASWGCARVCRAAAGSAAGNGRRLPTMQLTTGG
ncbi:hypothetical protein LNQ03_06155 [Klebsiella pneumoniae subsp. pneumoniae]|nr:hypothetical protein [Klebsiella pneumoniae subsp. pneumoniae]